MPVLVGEPAYRRGSAVNLRAIWFNPVTDPADYLALRFVTGFSRAVETPGRVARGAGGRVRVIRQAGRAVQWGLGFKALTRAQVGWLDARTGQVVCVRDDRGQKVFGTWLSMNVEERLYNKECDVTLTFTEVTYSEAV